MITIQDLQAAIAECQGDRNPNAHTCIKLAAYYTILEHMQGGPEETPTYSYYTGQDVALYSSNTEFYNAVMNVPTDKVWSIMDELMSTLSVVDPRLYASVMRKLGEV